MDCPISNSMTGDIGSPRFRDPRSITTGRLERGFRRGGREKKRAEGEGTLPLPPAFQWDFRIAPPAARGSSVWPDVDLVNETSVPISWVGNMASWAPRKRCCGRSHGL